MTLRLNGSTSGYVEIDAPATAGSNTLVLPNGNGTNGQYLQTNGSGGLSWATVAGVSVAVIADQKTLSTNGGSFTSGAWRTRDLNTEVSDSAGIVTLSSNQFTLIPGTYLIQWVAPANGVANHNSALYSITGSTFVAQSSNAMDYPDSGLPADEGPSIGSAVVSIGSSTTYEIQHRAAVTRNIDGFGYANGYGSFEQYTTVTIIKVA
jgi:hypothetical protein